MMKMLSMTNYKFGDVLLAKVPFSDFSELKKRPAIVISSDIYNSSKKDVIIIAVSSKSNFNIDLGEFQILNLEQSGLPKPSYVKSLIFSIHKELIISKFGSLSDEDKLQLSDMLNNILE